jgi:uncharacterized protein (TIGR03067 family)
VKAADRQHPDIEERERLEGTWIATAVTIDGAQVVDQDLAKVTLTIDDKQDAFKMILPAYEWNGQLWVNVRSKPPHRIYFILRDPGTAVRLGIYEAGDNLLKICVNAVPLVDKHPTDFTADKGSGRILLVMKRQAKEP